MKLIFFLALLFVGFLVHTRAAYRVANGDEGILWLWTKKPETTGEQWSRYSFYLWIASCFVAFLPISLPVAAGIPAGVMFAHTVVLSFRNWQA